MLETLSKLGLVSIKRNEAANMMNSPAETRASLILRLQDPQDAAAWDEFVEIYGPVISRVADRRGMQAADADDLIQQVLMSVANAVSDWLNRTDRGAKLSGTDRILY